MLTHREAADNGTCSLNELVEAERDVVRDKSSDVANRVFLGEYSGELQLQIKPDEMRDFDETGEPGTRGTLQVTDVTIKRTEVKDAETAGPNVTYHALVIGLTTDGSGRQQGFKNQQTFTHPMPAYSWVEETVPNFDLFPVEVVSGAEEVQDNE